MSNYAQYHSGSQLHLFPNFFPTSPTKSRIDHLINHHLDLEYLSDRLEDLPTQFINPQPRAWQSIHWHDINPTQIIGLRVEVFLSVLKGAMTVEEPIRGYSQVSWQYLQRFHAPMARFVGGKFAEDGSILELGLWEKEERQHSPALAKIYKQLTGEQLAIKTLDVKPYKPSSNPYVDMYHHGRHRVITEYGATCLYLWLMAHSTGALQQVLQEILLDEINHMTKFLGFGIWAFPESCPDIFHTLPTKISSSNQNQVKESKNMLCSVMQVFQTFRRVMNLVDWHTWHPLSKLELTYTFLRVMRRLWHWKHQLSSLYLQELFGKPPLKDIPDMRL